MSTGRMTALTAIALICLIIFQPLSMGRASQEQSETDKRIKEEFNLYMEGSKLTEDQSKELEQTLASTPDNRAVRIKLAGYYGIKCLTANALCESYADLLKWFIDKDPGLYSFAFFRPISPRSSDAYRIVKESWLKQIEAHAENPMVLFNASRFLTANEDATKAVQLLKSAVAIDSKNFDFVYSLALRYSKTLKTQLKASQGKAALQSFEEMEHLFNSQTGRKRLLLLGHLASDALWVKQWEKARSYANQLLADAPKHKGYWDYGNAIHKGNLVLGALALRSGDKQKAGEFLLAAGKTPGSPQLNSFGPNMSLAKALLQRRETKVVLQYFDLCAAFWVTRPRLNKWTSEVKQGRIPDFGANLAYQGLPRIADDQ